MDKKIFIVFVLLGLISLTADMVYEGARSASGAYLEHLEAPPIASAIVGVGEFTGYALRLVSGVLASYLRSSAAFWSIIALGYAMNVLTLPFLSFVSFWWTAVVIYLMERIGKGLRAPVRDVILAEVTEGIGKGKGFGLHEVMDQMGALAGPLLFAYILTRYGYSRAFLSLLIPGIATMAFILSAWTLYPKIKSVELPSRGISFRGMGRRFWFYISATVLQSLGFVHWAVASYFLKYWGVLKDAEIVALYAIAMGVDALAAFPTGYLYDVIGFRSLYIAPISTLAAALLLLARGTLPAYAMAILWGITMGISETVMRASVADMVGRDKLAVAYGVFGLLYGISWSAGGFIVTILLQTSTLGAVGYTILTQLASFGILVLLNRRNLT
ncbi:MAG: MFS transporter [Ignisphaera sp.]|nr:MFS transporter [Ignisphaera sp.]MCX8167861.1 MFS transporter [Ignisphaera sp.]MDW8086256.1 MFS transporter [Ignisphaera sp.]